MDILAADFFLRLCFLCDSYFVPSFLPHMAGYIGPGGIGDYGQHEACTGGAHGYIDRAFFTSTHIYQDPTAHWVYNTVVPYDPEGIVVRRLQLIRLFSLFLRK
jgi:heparan-alpha-glucosaminide N-acetyltransferase